MTQRLMLTTESSTQEWGLPRAAAVVETHEISP